MDSQMQAERLNVRPGIVINEAGHTGIIEAARSRRAAVISRWARATAARLRRDQTVMLVPLAAALGAGVIVAYAAALARAGAGVSLAALLIVLLAAALSSIAGFAFSAICGVMLLHVVRDPVQAVEIMMVCSIAIQSVSVALLWQDIDWRRLGVFLAGGPVGLPLGVGLLLYLDPAVCRHVIGALLTAYAVWTLVKPAVILHQDGRTCDLIMGFLGGVTGGLAGFPGATVAAWCCLKDWDKRRQRGVYQPFILIMQILALLLIQVMHPAGTRATTISLADIEFIPAAVLGTVFGLTVFTRLSDRHFAVTMKVLLLVSGLGLLF